jgi:flagellar biosynthesis protein FlhG
MSRTGLARTLPLPRRAAAPEPRLWAVGGGKGGVGKSVVASSLALALSRRGRRVVLVDLDLGGANLHTLLGVAGPSRTLAHFMTRNGQPLADLTAATAFPGLHLVSGSAALPDMANPGHARKQKLLRHLRTLPADEVVLDLGAGSTFDTLDFFLAARIAVVVVAPEPTAVENAYYFLKAALFRWLREVAKAPRARAALEQARGDREKHRLRSPRELLAHVAEIDPEVGALLADRARRLAPLLLVNGARSADHRELPAAMRTVCRAHLGIGARALGSLDHDEAVVSAVARRQPVLGRAPASDFARGVEKLVDRLLSPTPEPAR